MRRLTSLFPLAALAAMGACSTSASQRTEAPASAPTAAGERFSIYDLGSRWRDQHGTVRPLDALRGRPRALAMVYTHCAATCPLTIAEMKRIAAQTPDTVGLVLVSLDPGRDTSDRLAAYARELALDDARWTLLTAPDDAVRELAATIGVRYRRLSAAEVAHASVITLLDADGVVRFQSRGTDGTDEMIRLARGLAR